MKLKSIEFNGYRRLLKASCSVDGRTIAFVGPNEAGKSSILRGLEWLTDDSQGALPNSALSRRQPPAEDDIVVRAFFRLEDEDIQAIQQLQIDPEPKVTRATLFEFRVSKRRDGSRATGVCGAFSRSAKPFIKAEKSVKSLQHTRALAHQDLLIHDLSSTLEDCLDAILDTLEPGDSTWNAARIESLAASITDLDPILASLDGIATPSRRLRTLRDQLHKSIPMLTAALAAAKLPDPNSAIRLALSHRVPKFLLFSDDDRDLADSYQLSDETTRSYPPAPLRNLLTVAGTTVSDVWKAFASGDTAQLRTLQQRLNLTLRSRIQPTWTQSQITIQLALNQGGLLEVNIEELDSPDFTVTSFAERSDGLRAFLGLICFLVAAELTVPPVLMIDEAERNLHYDAQADLVRVLTNNLDVHKVLYTTHSPGCLPLDLGTGIRVVARDRNDAAVSIIKSSFWTGSEPGFSHLLFAMGAQAAAFSAFRRAVLTEGPADMILLPTLFRNATDGDELSFQIAFGLSNLPAADAASSVALVTTFLVDGDSSGNTKRSQLIKAGIPSSHIFQLPAGKATEDLVNRKQYLDIVNEYLRDLNHPPISESALDSKLTVARSVDDYAKTHLHMEDGLSHRHIASRLADLREDLKLTPQGKGYLRQLRKDLEQALSAPYVLGHTAHLTPTSP